MILNSFTFSVDFNSTTSLFVFISNNILHVGADLRGTCCTLAKQSQRCTADTLLASPLRAAAAKLNTDAGAVSLHEITPQVFVFFGNTRWAEVRQWFVFSATSAAPLLAHLFFISVSGRKVEEQNMKLFCTLCRQSW